MDLKAFDNYLFFPGQHWAHTWERQHELITRFAKYLSPSEIDVYAPLGLLNHNPISLEFIKKIGGYNRLQRESFEATQNPIEKNINMLNLKHIPFHNKLWGYLNYSMMRGGKYSKGKTFFWSTYVNPTVYKYFKKSDFRVYDMAERRTHNPLLPKYVKEWEKKIVAEADLVIADNHAIIDDYKNINPNIYYIPQGVNPSSFYEINDNREYIGYIGNLHFAIDYELFEKLIISNPNEKFMIIGGILEPKAKRLITLPNVEYIQQVAKYELNKYLAKMKYGLIPYLINERTIGVYPTKLFEYISAGVPVFSTALPEVTQYENDSYLKIFNKPFNMSGINFDMKGSKNLINDNTWDNRWHSYLKHINQI